MVRQRRPHCDVLVLGLAFGARGLVCPNTESAAKRKKKNWPKERDLAWLGARTLVCSFHRPEPFLKKKKKKVN